MKRILEELKWKIKWWIYKNEPEIIIVISLLLSSIVGAIVYKVVS